jgi:hypothetical protein
MMKHQKGAFTHPQERMRKSGSGTEKSLDEEGMKAGNA